jgi:hypothetical protein
MIASLKSVVSLNLFFRSSDMPEQRKKLMQMIGVAVSGLDRVDATLAAVAELGKRHCA